MLKTVYNKYGAVLEDLTAIYADDVRNSCMKGLFQLMGVCMYSWPTWVSRLTFLCYRRWDISSGAGLMCSDRLPQEIPADPQCN